MPNKRSGGRGLAIIIDTRIPELQPLLEADAYRSGTDELFDGIITRLPVDKTTEKADRMAAILGGVPVTAIAGVIASDRLLATPGILERIDDAFQGNVPVLNVNGELQVRTDLLVQVP